MLDANFFNTLFIFPILNALIALFKLFSQIGLPGALGFAIIALTAAVRLLLHPFFHKQMHTSMKMQEIKPHLDHLSKKHKGEPKKLQEEQMRLYKEAGINPASGCLFAIIQIPIFIGLYNTLNIMLTQGTGEKAIAAINKVLYNPMLQISQIDPWFFGYNLALSPAKAGQFHYYLLPVITAIFQYLQAKTTIPPVAAKAITDEKDGKEKESSTGEDFQKAMNTQMKYFFPIMIGYFSYTLPVGLSLYWNIFSIFSIIQHYRMKSVKDLVKTLEIK